MSDLYTTATQSFKTITDFLRFGLSKAQEANLYYGHGTDNAWDDIYALTMSALHLPFDCSEALWQGCLSADEKRVLVKLYSDRIESHIPVPYLTKEAHFAGMTFYVDERVLIPRSPIAELIDTQFMPWVNPDNVERILDLCTGSACIAIACCDAFPDAAVDAVDISPDALEVAFINRERHGLQDQLTLIQSDCYANVPKTQYDIIVSNPPYVSNVEMQGLPQEYRHEPTLALEAADNGLAIVDKILRQACDYLSDEGVLIVEVGNTEEAMIEAYPNLNVTWLEFEHGGQGVFLVTREVLAAYFASI